MLAQSVMIPSAAVLRNAAVHLGNGRSLAGEVDGHIFLQLRVAGSNKRTVAARVTFANVLPSAGAEEPGTGQSQPTPQDPKDDLDTIPAEKLPILTEVSTLHYSAPRLYRCVSEELCMGMLSRINRIISCLSISVLCPVPVWMQSRALQHGASLKGMSWCAANPMTTACQKSFSGEEDVHQRGMLSTTEPSCTCSLDFVACPQELARELLTDKGWELISADSAKDALGEDRISTAHVIIPKSQKGANPTRLGAGSNQGEPTRLVSM